MRRHVPAVFAVLSMILAAAAPGGDAPSAAPASASPPAQQSGRLVVHEWGTFTGLAGSDGVHLKFTSNVATDLPEFVLTRMEQQQRIDPKNHALLLDLISKDGIAALQRMETPVVYFYADEARDVDVRVDFPQGLLTEFYPPVRAMAPAYGAERGGELKGSSLDWGAVRILPGDGGHAVPAAKEKDHYAHARATDAAVVRFSDRPGETHDEKFLFYRGVGNFTLPVTLTAAGNDRFTIYNGGADPIAHAFLIRIENGRGRFTALRNVHGQRDVSLATQATDVAALPDLLVKALAAEGLYEKEARAMVKTWEASWFTEQGTGTRLLYTVPRRVTDAILPLKITPTPDETVRVLVGRIDVLTPEQEARLAAMLPRAGDGGAAGAIGLEEAREAKKLGRFLRPALDRAALLNAWKLLRAVHAVPDPDC